MRPLAALAWLCMIHTSAMYTDTFLQAFNRLGLSQWDGIEQDIAWGHVTSLMGLLRPSLNICIQSSMSDRRAGSSQNDHDHLWTHFGRDRCPL